METNFLCKKYLDSEFRENFIKCWKENGSLIIEEDGLEVIRDPFNCAILPNLISDEELLNEVRLQLQHLEIFNKNNDLYKFRCTGDLKAIQEPSISKLCLFISGPLRRFIQEVSGVRLTKKVSISSSVYKYTDTLLCHDDELEGRRIAFILYLVPRWEERFGGSLDLFCVDKHNRPHYVRKRIYPRFNSLAFFEVSPFSYHQVSEILTKEEPRISINGWFHGDPIRYPKRYSSKPLVYIYPCHIEEVILYQWLNPLYLDESTYSQIKEQFKEKSEIQLSHFLNFNKYNELATALRETDLRWRWTGPPNKRHVEVVCRRGVPGVVKEFLAVMQSEATFLILSQLTGLSLHPLAPEGSSSEAETEGVECEAPQFSGTGNERGAKKRKDGKVTKKKKKQKLSAGTSCTTSTQHHPQPPLQRSSLEEDWESDVEREALTELKCQCHKGEAKAEMSCEIRRWRWGSYSLMRDDDLRHVRGFVLDALLFLNSSKDWRPKFGGSTVFVAKGDEEELLTVLPIPNSLALIYRDSDTFKFTKHINIKSVEELGDELSVFHEIACEFREV